MKNFENFEALENLQILTQEECVEIIGGGVLHKIGYEVGRVVGNFIAAVEEVIQIATGTN